MSVVSPNLRTRVRAIATPIAVAMGKVGLTPNGLTLILNERKELPIVAANLVLKTGSDGNPLDKPGLANFVAAMLEISSRPQKTATSTAYVPLGAVANDAGEAASRG